MPLTNVKTHGGLVVSPYLMGEFAGFLATRCAMLNAVPYLASPPAANSFVRHH